MKQHNQIGKYTKKEEVLNTKLNKTYVTPNNRIYKFVEWNKIGRIYHYIIEYKGIRVNFKESDYNTVNLDKFFEINLDN